LINSSININKTISTISTKQYQQYQQYQQSKFDNTSDGGMNYIGRRNEQPRTSHQIIEETNNHEPLIKSLKKRTTTRFFNDLMRGAWLFVSSMI
jgi:hypothetical protein